MFAFLVQLFTKNILLKQKTLTYFSKKNYTLLLFSVSKIVNITADIFTSSKDSIWKFDKLSVTFGPSVLQNKLHILASFLWMKNRHV